MSNNKSRWRGRNPAQCPQMVLRHLNEIHICQFNLKQVKNHMKFSKRLQLTYLTYKIQVLFTQTYKFNDIHQMPILTQFSITINHTRVHISTQFSLFKNSSSIWICEEFVDGQHNFWGLVADKFSQEMLSIHLPLSKVVQHSSSPLLLAHPDMKKKESKTIYHLVIFLVFLRNKRTQTREMERVLI